MNARTLWQAWGNKDAHYAVLSADQYRKANLTAEGETEFFASGARHVAHVLTEAQRRLGAIARGKALDYGCGLGRLVLPLAERFTNVVGADVSSAMVERARGRAALSGIENVSWMITEDGSNLAYGFDFVHTMLVLQHNRPARARQILRNLASRLTDGGVAVINVTYCRHASRPRRAHCTLRNWLRPYDALWSLLQGRNPALPSLPMYVHDLGRIVSLLFAIGGPEISLEFFPQPAGFESVTLYWRRASREIEKRG